MTATSFPDYFISHAGIADNPGIPLDALEAMRREFRNNPSQLAAREHGLFVRPSGLVLPFDPDVHFEDLDVEQTIQLLKRCNLFGGIDFGEWRFAFVLFGVDSDKTPHLVEEYFSQREDLTTRAKAIIAILAKYGITRRFGIFGDCASPQDIREINKGFREEKSIFRCTPVDAEKKIIKVGVTRLINLMSRRPPAFRVRRTIGAGQVWFSGLGTSSAGIPVEGSRWAWEINNWLYPKNETEAEQKDVPDDNTADGADMMDATRYAIMSWWKPKKIQEDEEGSAFSKENLEADMKQGRILGNRLSRRRPKGRRTFNDGDYD